MPRRDPSAASSFTQSDLMEALGPKDDHATCRIQGLFDQLIKGLSGWDSMIPPNPVPIRFERRGEVSRRGGDPPMHSSGISLPSDHGLRRQLHDFVDASGTPRAKRAQIRTALELLSNFSIFRRCAQKFPNLYLRNID